MTESEEAAEPRPARRWRIADLRVRADDRGIDIEISMHGMFGNLVPGISPRHLAPDVRQALIAWLASAEPARTAAETADRPCAAPCNADCLCDRDARPRTDPLPAGDPQ